MGDLVKTYGKLIPTLELLDRLGVTSEDLERFRRASSWKQDIVGRIHRDDPYLWAMLAMEQGAKKVGFLQSDFEALPGDEEKLRQMLAFLRVSGIGSMAKRYTIDCDAKPFEPIGLTVAPDSEQLPNRVRGQFVFDGRVGLYISKHQKDGEYIEGNKLRKELKSEPVLSAHVLDFYLVHPETIPESLKNDENGNTRYTFFWGTIYRDADGGLYVRYLYFYGGAWRSGCSRLGNDWRGYCPAAVRAS